MSYRDLEPEQAQQTIEGEDDLRLLDVRTQIEHDRYHLPNSLVIPIEELQDRVEELDPKDNWLVYCEHGRRSVAVCHFLAQLGYQRLANLKGGITYWMSRGLPTQS